MELRRDCIDADPEARAGRGDGAGRMQNGFHQQVGVVDDDEAVRDSLQFLLETAGFSVVTFSSAAHFLSAARPDDLACLVVDQHMPELSGLQLVTRLRGQGVTLPIALITGSPSPDLVRLAHELGIVAVLEKPLDDDALLDFIEHARV
jgi:two-component system, LuxR family, response regulator FixJ